MALLAVSILFTLSIGFFYLTYRNLLFMKWRVDDLRLFLNLSGTQVGCRAGHQRHPVDLSASGYGSAWLN